MRRADWLDRIILALVAVLLLVVVPAVAGRALSPYDDTGRPVLLTAEIIAERRYLDEIVRPALDLVSEADSALANANAERGVAAYREAATFRDILSRLSATSQKLERYAPPARFASLHQQLSDLVSLYSLLAEEALAYFGDTNEEHWVTVRRGLEDGRPVLEMLKAVVEQVSLPVGPPRSGGREEEREEEEGLEILEISQ